MNKKEIIEKVAAGLRKMDIKPVAFIFNDYCQDWTYDDNEILGFPIFHSCFISLYESSIVDECPFFKPRIDTNVQVFALIISVLSNACASIVE